MRKLTVLLFAVVISCGTVLAKDPDGADTQPSAHSKPAKPSEPKKAESKKADAPSLEMQVEQLRQALEAQQQQIQAQQEKLNALMEELRATRAGNAQPGSNAPNGSGVTGAVNTTTAALNASATEATPSGAQGAKTEEAPQAIHIKGITLTPGGFFAAESVWRKQAASADINTPFTGIPFSGNSLSKVSEFNATGRQSRIAMLAEGKLEHAKFSGYYETDFLSAAATSNNRQSNSYSLRQRQFWGRAQLDGGWSFTGGQMWSLVTETKKGLENRTEAPPMTIDSQYNVGFGWARQYGFRVAKSFQSDKFVLGFAVEEPQTTFGGRGVPAGTFFINAPGAGGGLFNPADATGYTVNAAPDFIIKGAVDSGWGHFELFGVISTFRARVYPCGALAAGATCPISGTTGPQATGAFNDSRTGGGAGFNFRGPVFGKYGDFGIHVMGGDGVGRYGTAQLADVTARPGGTLAPIRGGNALGTLEFHPNPKLDVYFDYGVEYAYRTWYDTSAGGVTSSVGYGSPFFNNSSCNTEVPPPLITGNQNTPGAPASGTCNGDIRNIQEGTFGFWHKPYQGPKGGLRWGIQYSYIVKNTWSGNANTPGAVGLQPKAIDNMVFTSFRYVLP